MKRSFLLSILAITCSIGLLSAAPAARIGTLTFISGKIQIVRNAAVLPASKTVIGMQILDQDRIKVPKGASAELNLDPATQFKGKVMIRENTTFVVSIDNLKKNQKTDLQLLSGSVNLKLTRLTTGDNSPLGVRTGNATMGVRGTTFDVTIAPGGAILLSTEEGKVACTTDSGKEFFSTPDNIVQGSYDDRWNNENVSPADLAAFRQEWYNNAIATFRAAPVKAVKQFSTRYQKYLKDFNDAWTALQANILILKRWVKEDQDGNIGSDKARIMQDMKQVMTAMNKARIALYMLDSARMRLTSIQEFLDNSAMGAKLEGSQTVRQFYRSFAAEAGRLDERINQLYYYQKLYAQRSEYVLAPADTGDLDGGDFDMNVTDDEEFGDEALDF